MEEQHDMVWIPRWLLTRVSSTAISEYSVTEIRKILVDYPDGDTIEIPVVIVQAWVNDLFCRPYTHRVWYTLRLYIETESPEYTKEMWEKNFGNA
jgi:hypothetical protein